MTKQDKQARREGKIGAKIQRHQIDNKVRSYRREKYSNFMNGVGAVFGVILIAILLVNIFRMSTGGKTVSFTSFLNFLGTVDVSFTVPDLTYLMDKFTIDGTWAILDGFRIFLNSLGSILGVVAYLISNLVYSITFIAKLIVYLLG